MKRFRLVLVVIAAGFFLRSLPASAQTTDKQVIEQLLRRLADNEARILALEARLAPASPGPMAQEAAVPGQEAAVSAQEAAVPGQEAAVSAQEAAVSAQEAAVSAQDGGLPDVAQLPALPASMDDAGRDSARGQTMDVGPRLQIRGFADFTFTGSNQKQTTNSFKLGEFDLFMTSKLSDRWSFLAESVIRAARVHNTFGFEVERLLLTFHQSDYFNVAFGRYHQKIGYYNTAYHHGTYFQTSVGRPLLFAFEDEGGILPMHNVGVSAYGMVPSGKLGLHWVAEIGNGRTSRDRSSEFVQNVSDENNRKSVNFALFARPERFEGLEFGGSVLKDRLYPVTGGNIGQTVSSGYVVYQQGRVEFLNELVVVSNHFRGTNTTIHNTGFYTQVARRFHSVSPFFRYEYLNVNSRDPFFSDIGRRSGPLGGLRFEVGEFSAFKIQAGRSSSGSGESYNYLTGQVAFVF